METSPIRRDTQGFWMRILLSILSLVALISVFCAYGYWSRYTADPVLIAHAGGAIEGRSYTNSHDALSANARDYSMFEIDLSWTSDGHLVCIHNWHSRAERAFGRQFDEPPTLEEFKRLAALRPFDRNCTADSLMNWLRAQPQARLVTDIKTRNLDGLARLAKDYPDMVARITPQIFDPAHHAAVKAMGYGDVILALYRIPGTLEDITKMVGGSGIKAVSIDKERIISGLPLALKERDWPHENVRLPFPHKMKQLGIATYVHTVNWLTDFAYLRRSGVAGIFTDRIICPVGADKCSKKPYPPREERLSKQAEHAAFMAKATIVDDD